MRFLETFKKNPKTSIIVSGGIVTTFQDLSWVTKPCHNVIPTLCRRNICIATLLGQDSSVTDYKGKAGLFRHRSKEGRSLMPHCLRKSLERNCGIFGVHGVVPMLHHTKSQLILVCALLDFPVHANAEGRVESCLRLCSIPCSPTPPTKTGSATDPSPHGHSKVE